MTYRPDSLPAAFDRSAARHAGRTAILAGATRVSYATLKAQAETVTRALLDRGVQPGDPVALAAARAPETVAAMLGILRAGGIVVPLDPSFAPEQIDAIRADAAPVACVLRCADADRLPDPGEAILIDAGLAEAPGRRRPVPRLDPEAPAFLLYTSGTTGRPKGVLLPHRAIHATALADPLLRLGPGDVMLGLAPLSADSATWETFAPLLTGGTLALCPDAALDTIADTLTGAGVTVANWYAGLHHLMIDHRPEALAGLRLSVAGGDVMSVPHARKLLARYPDLVLVNDFGPTETCTHSLAHRVTAADLDGAIPVGRALATEEALILGDNLSVLPEGETGQLAIAGTGVALGYLNRPDETAARFIPDPRPGRTGTIYLTGDLARRRPDGAHEFLGRADRQVKLNGYRIELDAVEALLRAAPGVADAAVAVVGQGTARAMEGAVIPAAGATLDPGALLDGLAATTPRGMLPRHLRVLDAFPLTAAGKVDRKALFAATAAAPVPTTEARDLPATIAAVFAEVLGLPAFPEGATFFEAGGASLHLIEAHARLEARLGRRFDLTLLFEAPRVADLARRLDTAPVVAAVAAPKTGAGAIAVTGMAVRVPGADTLAAFAELTRSGRSAITRLDPAQMEDRLDRGAPGYVAARGLLDDVAGFDAGYWKMLPAEAAKTDPQARVFLDLCLHALEDAAIDPDRTEARVGVVAGASMSTYLLQNLMHDRAALEAFTSGYQVEDYVTLSGNDSDGLVTRVAWKLGLRGPALAVSTACSTGLVAIAQAVTMLRAGQADAVLAGGVSVTFPEKRGYLHQEGGMVSPDGLCRPFDAEAGGTVFSHGAGVVVLKRLEDAERDGDRIHAVIRGVGINNDGAAKMSFTAPSVGGQAEAIRAALADAGVPPETVGLVECHGTATPLGDPIEVAGLAAAYGADGRCALGSVKGNIGHLDAAAGVVGFIKAALAVRDGVIPPVAHFRRLNPRITLEGTPFFVPDAVQDWPGDGPRRAGVSSLGVGGTNAHVVIEAAPHPAPCEDTGLHLLPLSAHGPEALTALRDALADRLAQPDAPALADVAATLRRGRRVLPHRLAVAAATPVEAAEALRATRPVTAKDAPRLVFLFPGQGAQYPGMGSGLYASEPGYRRWIDAGAEILRPLLGRDLRPLLDGSTLAPDEAAAALRETWLTQPALMLTQYACAQLWAARGVTPDLMIGHSVGEITAATLAGVMSFEDALRLIAARGRLMMDQPPGGMLSVRLPLDALLARLPAGLDLAAQNAPQLQVVAGPDAALDAFAAALQADGIAHTRLHTSHAFHSAMMEPVIAPLHDLVGGMTLAAPAVPLISTVTGREMDAATATDPDYWAAQARKPVLFEAALRAASPDTSAVHLEIGASGPLSAFAAQALDRGRHRGVFKSLPDHARSVPDEKMMAATAANLWAAGVPLDLSLWAAAPGRPVSLPGTRFQRKRHWVDPPAATATTAPVLPVPLPVPAPVPEPAAMTAAPADRLPRLTSELLALLSEMSGEALAPEDAEVPFLDLGFDSLFLGQVSQALKKTWGIDLSFRRLMADFPSAGAVAAHLDASLPADPAPVAAPPAAPPAAVAAPAPAATAPVAIAAPTAPAGDLAGVLQAQMQTMQAVFDAQLRALGTAPAQAAAAPPPAVVQPVARPVAAPQPAAQPAQPPVATAPDEDALPKGFKTGRGPSVTGGTMTPEQTAFARDLARRYAEKHARSKAYTAQHRARLADPRTAAGFRAEWKELVFPIVAATSKGAHITDLDGNRFVDLVNGFGQTGFGHSPDFVVEAVTRQMEKGFPIGPQADLAGPVAEKFARVVGHERVTFCNTGSEAVMAAMRLARTVTGREKIVVFDHDYHGQFDEVLVRGKTRPGGDPNALPIAPGIPRSGLTNMAVLKYGDAASLDWIAANIDAIAGVIVEPVQSRHPELRPEGFVRRLREITRQGGAALIIDEVVTGFRTHVRGMQGVWGLQADMATYGKVVGGGMPIGVLAGDAAWMDALDGGAWSYGDDSRPEAIPTFFAGTFVRHPLVLAAVDATLDHIEGEGARLYDAVIDRTAALATRMGQAMEARGLPNLIEHYSSWFVINVTEKDPRATLLFPLMRMEGVHVMDGFCGFLTTAHSEADIAQVERAFTTALDALLSVGILGDLQDKAKALPLTPPPADIPLTPGQQEIWLAHQMGDQAAAAFNECGLLSLEGALDVAALGRALDGLVARHDALRLRFAPDGRSFRVTGPAPLPLPVLDLSAEADPQGALDAHVAEDGATPFDLTAEAAVRAALLRLGPDAHVLRLTAHHIVADGWSFGVLLDDLAALYAAETTGTPADLPAAPSFADHARTATPPAAATLAHWRGVYTDLPAPVDLPADRPRGPVRSHAGATRFHEIDTATLKAVKAAGAKAGCTLFATLFAAMQITVARLTGARDVVLGVPTAGQADLPDPNLVGHLVNFLPVRAGFGDAASVGDHLRQARDRLLAAFDHGQTTFGQIVAALDVPRDLSRTPLTSIEFNLEKDVDLAPMPGLRSTFRPSAKAAVGFDLFFNVCEKSDGLRIDAHYNRDLYEAARVDGWCALFETVLTKIASDAAQPLEALIAPAPAEAAPAAYDRGASALDLIRRGIARDPARVAVEAPDGQLTHADLAARVDTLAALIHARLPEPGQRVAVALPRGADMLAALLAVWQAGHVLVPLDPKQPPERLALIRQTAGLAAVLSNDPALAGTALHLDPADAGPGPVPQVPCDPGSAAYILFTSGSTGTPKGVTVPHRALVNFLTAMAEVPGFTEADTLLAVTTVGFDIALLELLLPLAAGGRVVIAPAEDVAAAFPLAARLAKGDITHMQATPTLWDMVLTAGFTPGAGMTLLAGGEPLPRDLADRLRAGGATLWNMYGPTETTIWSSLKRLDPGADITIGTPIANTTLHVLNPEDRPVPEGVTGELFIGGDGLALGYHDRPDLTARAFREVTLGGVTRRLYATGDLARRRADGEIELLGRIDGQVKLRGFRIELGEIETALRAVQGIAQAAVALRARESGDKVLVGYLVPEAGQDAPAPDRLAAALAPRLPDYMIPRGWVTLSRLPQTANGKLDRNALPEPGAGAEVTPLSRAEAPATETETRLHDIWCRVLGRDAIGVTDTLFALGVDSLAVFRIAAKMLDAGLGLEAKHMLAHPSIRALAAFHDAHGADGPTGPARPSLSAYLGGARRSAGTAGGGK
jgi:amino acid adenylation domain-containing protein